MIGDNFNIGPLGMMGLSILGNSYGPNSRNAIGQGAMQGLLMHQQMQGADQMQKMRQMQLDEMKRKFEDQDAARAVLQDVYAQRGLPKSSPPDGQTPTPAGLSRSSAAAFGAPEFATPDVPTMASGSVAPKAQVWQQYRAIGDAMSGRGLTVQAQQYYDMAEKFRPKFKADSRTVRMPDGRIATVNMSEDGNEVVSGYAPAEKLNFQNLGSQTVGLDPYSGHRVAEMRNTMSPDAVASNAVAWANNRLSADRLGFEKSQANKPQFKDGYWVVPPGPGQDTGQIIETPLSAPPKGSPQALRQSSDKVIGLIDQAGKLLEQSTGSYIGAGADATMQAFGMSTKGAKAAAQLKAMEGALMMAQPRMEGPQSDKDVALYRQMAGQIGDSTVPVETRRAALNTIRDLHQKYASTQGAPQSVMSGGGWSATVVK